MNETEFNQLIDDILMNIEDQIDAYDIDIDCETHSGILTLIMPNSSQIIINRQTFTRQLWLAAKSGGFHYEYSESAEAWLDTRTGIDFEEALNRCLNEQSGVEFNIRLD